MSRARAFAKLNLALVVGALRPDGKHDVVTALQAIDLHDEIALELERADLLRVEGFAEDTLVRDALEALAAAAGVEPRWRVRIEKRIPVAAGLGGGSSDAATALRLANATLPQPFGPERLHALAAGLGADVPFFLEDRTQLATGDGSELSPLDLPHDYVVLVVLPAGESKESTEAVYRRFDQRRGADGFDDRRARLLAALAEVGQASDLANLPKNDLASSPLAAELERLGAFRADVSGAGPAVYGLFEREPVAARAAATLVRAGQTWIVRPLAGARDAGG
jgi:4-diphosphocytidyl-2-C-methyl-D-erythritol kinase